MSLHYLIATVHDALHALIDFFTQLPAPAAGALLIAAGVCLYETLGNSRILGKR